MKRIIAFIICAVMVLALASCGEVNIYISPEGIDVNNNATPSASGTDGENGQAVEVTDTSPETTPDTKDTLSPLPAESVSGIPAKTDAEKVDQTPAETKPGVQTTPAPTPTQDEQTHEIRDGWIIETADTSTGNAAYIEDKTFRRKNYHLTNVEEYVNKVIRPIYVSVEENHTPLVENDGVVWYMANPGTPETEYISYASPFIVYEAGTDGDKYERRYYFDSNVDSLVFAFVYLDTEEHRLYFYKDSVIRYISPEGEIYDNPTQKDILDLANKCVKEAYVHWD